MKSNAELSARIHRLIGFSQYIWSGFRQDKCQDTAAALTYQTLFAVVPLLTMVYAALSMIAAFSGLQQRIEDFVFANFVPQSGAVVQEYLHTFSEQARQLTVAGILFLMVTAVLMLSTIERAFNEIWRTDEPRRGLSKFLLYWAVLSLGPLLVGLALVVSTYILSLPLLSDVAESIPFLELVPVVLSILVFTLIYAAVPNCQVLLKHALFGGTVVAVLFELAKELFSWLVAKSSFELIYGAFASVPLFLLWVYLAWTLILGGAELVRGLAVYDSKMLGKQEVNLFQMLAVLNALYVAHQEGKSLSEVEILTQINQLARGNWNNYRKILLQRQLIKRLDSGGFVLSRDLHEISVWELYKSLPWPLPERGVILDSPWQRNLSSLLEQLDRENSQQLDMSLASLLQPE